MAEDQRPGGRRTKMAAILFTLSPSARSAPPARRSNLRSQPLLGRKGLRNQYGEMPLWRLKWGNSIHILRARRSRAPWGGLMRTKSPKLPTNYRPSDDEEFMSPKQLEYFRQKLLRWRADLLADSTGTLRYLKEESLLKPDLTDRASLETERAIELRTRDRERKLISKIDSALQRIDTGTYGFCEETDQPIGIRRLEARPIATLSIEAQERHERMERTYRDE